MTKLYKFTDEDGYTRRGKDNETQWVPGYSYIAVGYGNELCTNGLIHAYENPVLGSFILPLHLNFNNVKRLFLLEGEVVKRDGQLKVGCKTVDCIKEIPLPEITREQRIAFGILCAKEVYKDTKWNQWADAWLDGSDRTKESAWAADDAANAAYYAAGYAAYWAAKAAAKAAAYVADAYVAAAYYAAANAAYYAANAAADAAADAANAKKDIDLIQIAKKAMEY